MKNLFDVNEANVTFDGYEPTISYEPDERRPVNDILGEYLANHPDNSEWQEIIDRLTAVDVWDLDCGAWDDQYDILGYLPPCPRCRSKMRFNDAANMLQCPECGYSLDGNAYPYRNMPSWDEITEEDYKL